VTKKKSFPTLKPNLSSLMLLVIYKMTASSFQIISLVGITIRDGQKKQGRTQWSKIMLRGKTIQSF